MNRRSTKPAMARSGLGGFIPFAVTLLMVIFMLLPVGTDAVMSAFPHLPMIAVFYWTCHRPLSMPLGAAALTGFILDLWLGVPLGLNMLLLVGMRAFVVAQLKHFKGRGQIAYWAVFAIICLGCYAVAWLAGSYATNEFLAPGPLLNQAGMTIALYPLITWLMNRVRLAWM